MHTHSPNKPRKFKQSLANRKLKATVFWDRKGVLLNEFMEPGTTITSETYCETLKKLSWAIENKRRGMFASGVVLLHYNARPHTQLHAHKLCSRNFVGTFLTIHPTARTSPRVISIFLHERKSGWEHSAYVYRRMRSWWMVSRTGSAPSRQLSMMRG